MDIKIGQTEQYDGVSYKLINFQGTIGWKFDIEKFIYDKIYEIPSTYKDYPVISMENLFANYPYQKLNISKIDTSNIISMVAAFSNMELIKELDLSTFNTSNVKYMDDLFHVSRQLENVNISNLDTSKVVSADSMFGRCFWLKKIDLSKLDLSSLESARLMFFGCNSIKELKLPIKPMKNIKDINSMFWGCKTLRELDASSIHVKDTNSIDKIKFTFDACDKLDLLIIGSEYLANELRRNNIFTVLNYKNIKNIDINKIKSKIHMLKGYDKICICTT